MKLAAALFSLCFFLSWQLVQAGTSGTITGSVLDDATQAPVDDALITVSSTSQTSSALTDDLGRFTFASLVPDRYSVTIEKAQYELVGHRDVRVFADQTVSLDLRVRRRLSEIAHVTSRSGSDLVRSGTTSDVYSVDATLGEKEQALGGGGELNTAYAAIGSVPGVYVPQGQQGWQQFIYIRGGDYDQVGYEYDGVPLNRAFDNFTAGTLSSLGQQEVQVYTGGGPSSATATGISGFINQVIRTGTYPSHIQFGGGIGAPAFYHQLQFEASGASPNRRFAYYAGFSGYNQDYRLVDPYNGGGAVFPYYAVPIQFPFQGGAAPTCVNGGPPPTVPPGVAFPSCYTFAPGNIGTVSNISDREAVVNLHYRLPHRNGMGDDLQFLFSGSALVAHVYDSQNDVGPATITQAFGGPAQWPDGIVFPNGTQFGQKVDSIPLTGNDARCNAPSLCTTYFFPSSPTNRTALAALPADIRGAQENDAAVFKAQFQRNFGSTSYARIFAYSFYSTFIENDPNNPVTFLTPDYELNTHTRGVELQIAKQTGNHFLKGTANYTTATTTRFNNTTMEFGPRQRVTNLIDANGNCYEQSGSIAACNAPVTEGSYANPEPYAPAGQALANGAAWAVTGARGAISERGTYNGVSPAFFSMSLSDQFRPESKLFIDAGVRYEKFRYNLASSQTDAYNFWFKAAQREYCYDPSTLEPDLAGPIPLVTVPGSPCPINAITGVPEVHPDGLNGHLLLSNTYPNTVVSSVLSPRIGVTYTESPLSVWRASFGVYSEPADSAHVQFLQKQPNLPAFIFPPFWRYGYTTPRHAVQPEIANTYDVSYERRFRHSGISVKITPFLRETRQQRQLLLLSVVPPFATALNVGHQRSEGVELALSAGDFSQDGLAAWIAYTYTTARVRYDNYPGTNHNTIDIVNDQIRAFNRFTAQGGGFPCYQAAINGPGAGETAGECAADANAIENPYYHAQEQSLLDPAAWYVPFDFFPTYFGVGTDSFYSPNTLTAVLQYQRHGLAITPSLQLNAGTLYGVPLHVAGIDPSSCLQNSATAGIAAPNPHQAEYTSCGNTLAVPNPENGNRFDRYGEWHNPSQISVNMQLAYRLSGNIRATLILANLYNRCFGGSSTSWSQAAPPGAHGLCSYGGISTAPYVSNLYNGFGPNDVAANGGPLNPFIAHSYQGASFAQPFQAFFELQVTM